ncbi:MAG: hypothetical protein P4L67_04475 [Candidatus Pacebacteria bacterium]|nr:hypothetical protein [Candidatus Paceibacterota bacterium]
MNDVLTAIEVDDKIGDATDGMYGAVGVTAVVVREVSRSESRDGFPEWAVEVVGDGFRCVLKAFRHDHKQAAVIYASEVADAMGLNVG